MAANGEQMMEEKQPSTFRRHFDIWKETVRYFVSHQGMESAGNMAFIRRLSAEADTLARKMGEDLPPGYPLGLHEATLAVLD